MQERSPIALSRRSVLAGVAGLTLASIGGRPARAENGAIFATALARLKLLAEPKHGSDVVGRIDSGASVSVLAGPTVDGWYQVQSADGQSEALGWTSGDNLQFSQRALVLWDVDLFTGASAASPWIAAVRHGIVVTVAGPSTVGFTFIRFGDLRGFVGSDALQRTDQPATDPLGEWWADVNRSTLTVNLMIGTSVVDAIPAAMSTETGEGFYSTAPGRYWIYEKVPGLQYTSYAKAWIMYWCGFDPYRFNGFHSWTMDANGYLINGGWGNTAGCVATEPSKALIIYNFLSLNSRVEIHW